MRPERNYAISHPRVIQEALFYSKKPSESSPFSSPYFYQTSCCILLLFFFSWNILGTLRIKSISFFSINSPCKSGDGDKCPQLHIHSRTAKQILASLQRNGEKFYFGGKHKFPSTKRRTSCKI